MCCDFQLQLHRNWVFKKSHWNCLKKKKNKLILRGCDGLHCENFLRSHVTNVYSNIRNFYFSGKEFLNPYFRNAEEPVRALGSGAASLHPLQTAGRTGDCREVSGCLTSRREPKNIIGMLKTNHWAAHDCTSCLLKCGLQLHRKSPQNRWAISIFVFHQITIWFKSAGHSPPPQT